MNIVKQEFYDVTNLCQRFEVGRTFLHVSSSTIKIRSGSLMILQARYLFARMLHLHKRSFNFPRTARTTPTVYEVDQLRSLCSRT